MTRKEKIMIQKYIKHFWYEYFRITLFNIYSSTSFLTPLRLLSNQNKGSKFIQLNNLISTCFVAIKLWSIPVKGPVRPV